MRGFRSYGRNGRLNDRLILWKTLRKALGIVWVAFALFAQGALASRLAEISSDEVEIHEQPNTSSKVLGKLVKGNPVAAANVPLQGFIKIRTTGDLIGWIPVDSLKVDRAPSSEQLVEAGAPDSDQNSSSPPPPRSDQAEASDLSQPREKYSDLNRRRFQVRLLSGANFVSLVGVAGGVRSPITGFGLGGEVGYRFSEHFGAVLRSEYVQSSTVLTDTAGGVVYEISANFFPIVIGPEYIFLGSGGISFRIGVFGGVAGTFSPSSDFSTPIAMGRAGLSYHVTPLFSLFAELGYRLAFASISLPAPTPGSSLFLSNFGADVSGFLANGGVGFSF